MLPQRCASLVLTRQCQTLHLSRSIVSSSDRPFLMLDFYRRPSPAPNQLYFLQVPWVAMRSWSWPQIGSNRSHWEKCLRMSGQMWRSLRRHLWKNYWWAIDSAPILLYPRSWPCTFHQPHSRTSLVRNQRRMLQFARCWTSCLHIVSRWKFCPRFDLQLILYWSRCWVPLANPLSPPLPSNQDFLFIYYYNKTNNNSSLKSWNSSLKSWNSSFKN